MILVDTSAWVEYLRSSGSMVDRRLADLIASGAELFTTDVIVMEVLAGTRDEHHAERLRRMLAGVTNLPVEGPGDYEMAAEIYRACHRAGVPVRSLTDCLVASVAIRANAAILHADRDFDAVARYTPLRLDA